MKEIKKVCSHDFKISLNGKKKPIKLNTIQAQDLMERIRCIVKRNTKSHEDLFRQNQNFTVVMNENDHMRMEEILERMIVKVWNDKQLSIANQFPLNTNNRKEDIDIVLFQSESQTKIIRKIIELKYKSDDTPLFGMLELIKNYFILEIGKKHEKIEELILLAPKFFYDSCERDYLNSIFQIRDLLGTHDMHLPPIKLKYLNLKEKDVETSIKNIVDHMATQKTKDGNYIRIKEFNSETLNKIAPVLTDWPDYSINDEP
jgi:hypothetical protein